MMTHNERHHMKLKELNQRLGLPEGTPAKRTLAAVGEIRRRSEAEKSAATASVRARDEATAHRGWLTNGERRRAEGGSTLPVS